MNRTRIYWFCLLGIGVLNSMQGGSDLLASGSELSGIAALVGGVAIIVAALYSLTHPNETSDMANKTVLFWAVVLAFVLVLAGTVLQFA